jgi:cytochrome c peroxidase
MRAEAAAVALLLGCALAAPPPPEPPTIDPDRAQRGGTLFLDTNVSGDGARACSSCHPGGGSDGNVYRDGEPVEPGTPGARKAPRLWGLWQTPPYLWDGSEPELRPVIERMLRVEMRGGSLAEPDLQALETYLLSLRPFDRGRILADGSPADPSTLRQRRGSEIFERAGCTRCHPAPVFAHPRPADVGSGGSWSVPTLRGLTSPGAAPYGHDGRWATLERAVDAALTEREADLSELEREDLLEYLRLL